MGQTICSSSPQGTSTPPTRRQGGPRTLEQRAASSPRLCPPHGANSNNLATISSILGFPADTHTATLSVTFNVPSDTGPTTKRPAGGVQRDGHGDPSPSDPATARLEEGRAHVGLHYSWANQHLHALPLDTRSLVDGIAASEVRPSRRLPTDEAKCPKMNNDMRPVLVSCLPPGTHHVQHPGNICGRPVHITEITGCSILLLDTCEKVEVVRCQRCFVFIGPTKGEVVLDSCVDCVIVTAAGVVKISSCARLVLSLCTPVPPIMHNSTMIGVTSLCGWWMYKEMPCHMRAAQLSPFNNTYSTVRELSPLRAAGSAPCDSLYSFPQAPPCSNPPSLHGSGKRNFFYLDPWLLDRYVWCAVVAGELLTTRRKGAEAATAAPPAAEVAEGSLGSSSIPPRSPRAGAWGALPTYLASDSDDDHHMSNVGTAEWADTPSLLSAVTMDDVLLHGFSSPLRGGPTTSTTLPFAAVPPQALPSEEDRMVLDVLNSIPMRSLRSSLEVAVENKATIHNDLTTVTPGPSLLSLKTFPLGTSSNEHTSAAASPTMRRQSQQCIEDALRLYRSVAVVPFTFGAALIPPGFFLEGWRLKLFIVTNANGGWRIAQRVAADVELARRETLLNRNKSLASHGSLFVARYASPGPLSERCGPVLLLNTVELRCTNTVMQEYVAPVFYNLTETSAATGHPSTLHPPPPPPHSPQTPGRGAAPSPPTTSIHAEKRSNHTEAAEQSNLAMRRLLGGALQRMCEQTCVLFLALTAPPPTRDAAAAAIFNPRRGGHSSSPPEPVGRSTSTDFSTPLPSSVRRDRLTESEEEEWPRAVVLNVTVPLQAVSMLQGSIFFRGSLASLASATTPPTF